MSYYSGHPALRLAGQLSLFKSLLAIESASCSSGCLDSLDRQVRSHLARHHAARTLAAVQLRFLG